MKRTGISDFTSGLKPPKRDACKNNDTDHAIAIVITLHPGATV